VEGNPNLVLGPDFTCGYLTVPENRSNPGGKTIQVAVATQKARSASPKPDPILYLSGGPGGSGLVEAIRFGKSGWNADRDVIFLDQRGTLKAKPFLSCPEANEFEAASVSRSLLDPATGEQSAAAAKACRDRLVGEGWDLAAFDSAENAADIADLRVALGIDEWNLVGISYGTDLALQTYRDHPEGIRTLTLDSMAPPQAVLFDDFFWGSARSGYDAVFSACAGQPACAAAYPNVRQEFFDLVDRLTTAPRTVTTTEPATGRDIDVVLDGFKLANMFVVGTLNPAVTVTLPRIVHDLATGDGKLAAAALLNSRLPVGFSGDGLAYGAFCREQAARTNPEQAAAAGRRAVPEFPAAVTALTPQVPRVFGDCREWNVPPADARAAEPATGDVPVLVLSGSFDAVTAPRFAKDIVSGLPRTTVVEFPGSGQTVLSFFPECAVSTMRSFQENPSAPDSSCVATLQIPPFTT
jgi:pimeloyl-ACP methyl ester carboxylesterase